MGLIFSGLLGKMFLKEVELSIKDNTMWEPRTWKNTPN